MKIESKIGSIPIELHGMYYGKPDLSEKYELCDCTYKLLKSLKNGKEKIGPYRMAVVGNVFDNPESVESK